jgi:copper resistance protein C
MSQNLTLKIVVALAVVVSTSAAFAHAQLQKAAPAVGGTVSASPTEIRLKFSEVIEPRFSGIALATPAAWRSRSAKQASIPPTTAL